MAGRGKVSAAMVEIILQCGEQIGRERIHGSYVRRKAHLVNLIAALEHGGGDGNAEASSEVSRERGDAGGIAHFFIRNRIDGYGGKRHEDKGHPGAHDDLWRKKI